ncbi:MAG: methyltransferase domain-containing protein [Betaproteobacteria bacterium]
MAGPAAGTMLSRWLESHLGRYLLEREQAFFDEEVVDVFGFHALQFGLPGHDFLRTNRIACRVVAGPDVTADLRADLCELPVATGSIDLVVLPHHLEFSVNPHQVLREVQRVLVPEGHIVLAGFNPWSLWGGARRLARADAGCPWNGQFISLPRLRDWLALLNFELISCRNAIFVPPCRREPWLRRFGFMEQAGERWWPFAGGVYLLHGIKRVHGMRLITPKWRMAAARRRVLAVSPRHVADLQQTTRRSADCLTREHENE